MRLNQVTAAAIDLDASIAFYELLGLKLIVKSDHYARFELPRGEATFSLHVVAGDIPRENAPQLYFEVDHVDFEVRRLKHAGVVIEREPVEQSWLWYEAWLHDPAGNAICLFHAGEMRRYPPWRLDASPGAKTLQIVMNDDGTWLLVKFDGDKDAWRTLQDRYPRYKTSLGPFDLFSLLAMLEREWPDVFLEAEQQIRAFAVSEETEMSL